MSRWMNFLIALIAFALLAVPARSQDVRVEGGLISGTNGFDPQIRVFKGVPYAAPPVGNLRWRPPQPVVPWQGVRKADEFSKTCMQPERPKDSVFYPGFEPTSEDCLYLNIWTPVKTAKARLPVMVYIHGGGFRVVSGSEKYFNGERLAEKGVIVVTFNYRLGPFGFLADSQLDKESARHVSGNYGVLDQIAAMKWVQKNIAAFGGDPKRVTIFGQSAGANSVCFQVASPLSKGLYVRAIAESVVGCMGGNAELATLKGAEAVGDKFMAAAGASSIAELREKPADELLKIAARMPFRPVVDGYFLPSNPYSIYSHGRENHVPFMVGSNADEGTLLSRPPASAEDYIQMVRKEFGSQADELLKMYPADSDAQARASSYRLFRDEVATQAYLLTGFLSRDPKDKTYRYFFSRKPPVPEGMFREQARTPLGAFHSSELEYVFDNLNTRPYPWTDIDRKLAGMMSTYWTNFAKTGNPNGPGLPAWPACDSEHDVVLEFGDTVEVRQDFEKTNLEFLASAIAKKGSAD
jgi:para-nitrobenzyl esterase